MAKRLFLEDSYLKSCETIVVSVNGCEVVFAETVFYAQSGGQPCDTGKVICGAEVFNVLSVRSNGVDVIHILDKPGLVVGDKVRCEIDWEKRYKHMRMHSSAHVLAAILNQERRALITGNQLGEQESRMDFSVKDFDRTYLKGIEDKANEAIQRDFEIKISFEERDKALQRKELFRLKDVLPKDIPVFRILSISDFDIQADGGTHVAHTKEIGKIVITDMKNKGAENRRIYWKLE
ncbi:MAG: alanyl-tRNA editing protein [archaeon]